MAISDMAKTHIFRIAVAAVLLPSAALVLAIADYFLSAASQYIYGIAEPRFVERVCFIGFIAFKLLNWIWRRVWIGSTPKCETPLTPQART